MTQTDNSSQPSASAEGFCFSCGAAVHSDDRFCQHCGTRLMPVPDRSVTGDTTMPPGVGPSESPSTPTISAAASPTTHSTAAAPPAAPSLAAGSDTSKTRGRRLRGRRRAALVVLTVAIVFAGAAFVALPRVLVWLHGDQGVWLVSRPSSSGGSSLYYAREDGDTIVRGAKIGAGSLVRPVVAGSVAPSALPYVPWTASRRLFTVTEANKVRVVLVDENEKKSPRELLSVDGSSGAVAVLAKPRLAVVWAGSEDSGACYLLRPDAPVKKLDGEWCNMASDAVVTKHTVNGTTEIVRYDLTGAVQNRVQWDSPDVTVSPDTRWTWTTAAGGSNGRLEVRDTATGQVIHASPGDARASVLATPGRGHGLVYALEAGDGQVTIVHLRPDGSIRRCATTSATAAALSDDGATAWYTTGGTDKPDRELFRASGDQAPVSIGRGSALHPVYLGGPRPRLLAYGSPGNNRTEVWVAAVNGELQRVDEISEASFSYAGVNPKSGIVYAVFNDSVTEPEGAAPHHTGALLRIDPQGEHNILAKGYESFSSVVASPDDKVVAAVGNTGAGAELLVGVDGAALTELDSAPSISTVLLHEKDVYFSTAESAGGGRARWVIADGSRSPITLFEDMSWVAVPEPSPDLLISYDRSNEVTASTSLLITDGITQNPAQRGQVFFSRTIGITAGKSLVLSASPDGKANLQVDDVIGIEVIHQDGTRATFSHDFSINSCAALAPAGPFDLQSYLEPGHNQLTVLLADACGGSAGTTPLYFVGDFKTVGTAT
jgi:hypothetical protein